MSEPLRINCQTTTDIPPVNTIRQFVTADQHLVLQFPSGAGEAGDLRALMERLSRCLPDYTVFASAGPPDGTSRITIRQVISERDVIENEEAIVGAAREFRRLAHELMLHVAHRLGVPLDAFGDRFIRFQLEPDQDRGDLRNAWRYWFHGGECRLTNAATGQTLDVCLGFGREFGVLDPWFFHVFLSTTPGMEALARLLRDGYHDPSRAFEILQQRGHLKRIPNASQDAEGLIAPDP